MRSVLRAHTCERVIDADFSAATLRCYAAAAYVIDYFTRPRERGMRHMLRARDGVIRRRERVMLRAA